MNFMEAIKAMKKGKKIRRESFADNNQYWNIDGGTIIDSKYGIADIGLREINGTDWEIADEDKDWTPNLGLSADNFKDSITGEFWCGRTNVVTLTHYEKLKKLILNDLKGKTWSPNFVTSIINKRFGDLK